MTFLSILLLGIEGHQIFGFFIFLFLLIDFINKLGRQFIFIEILALIAWVLWIIGPIIFERAGAKMPVSYSDYFSYAYPGAALYLLGLYIPTYNIIKNNNYYFAIRHNLVNYLGGHHRTGIILVLIGIPAWMFEPYAPEAISYILSLLSYLILIGLSYLIFSKFKNKLLIITFVFLLVISKTLLNGMIGTLVFWLLILLIYRSVYKPFQVPIALKWLFLVIGLWGLAIMQSAKSEYRAETWNIKKTVMGGEGKRNIKQDPSLFLSIITDRVLNPSKIISPESSLEIFSRLNQGYLVSLAMNYVPKRQEFGAGDVTIKSTLQAFIPRIFWPDKPSIGAKEYYKKYTGITLGKYHSATLGALGDAYVDYGKAGIIFLFLFGLLIGGYFRYFILKSFDNPAYILWFIMPFYMSMTVAEVSVPSFLNALFKVIIFIFIIRFILLNKLKLVV